MNVSSRATCSKCVSYLKCSFWWPMTFPVALQNAWNEQFGTGTWSMFLMAFNGIHGLHWVYVAMAPSILEPPITSSSPSFSLTFFSPAKHRSFISAYLFFLEHHNRNLLTEHHVMRRYPCDQLLASWGPITHASETREPCLHDLVFSRTWSRLSCPNLQATYRLRDGFFLVTH